MNGARKIRIESLGAYLPGKVLTMEELLSSCRRRPPWDLERITGIRERRVAVGEYAIDLAVQAADRALALSRHGAADLDAVICASISKHNGEDEFHLEPAGAGRIAAAIGAHGARSFDVVNACAGMMTGIHVLRGLIRAGEARCGMVVAGEHNLPVTRTAARELRHRFDGQMAALTLGDGGAAVILDAAPAPAGGFHHMELVTGARHDHYCYSRPSRRGAGGILVTRAHGLQRKGNEHFPAYLKEILDRTGWTLEDVDHIIPHQVSVRGIENSARAVERYLGSPLPPVVRISADLYANTSTTSHFLALHRFILDGTIRSGDNLLFVSGASGIVISHATYTFDDLPGRYRTMWGKEGRP